MGSIQYERAAIQHGFPQAWICLACGTVYCDERVARMCCSTDRPCSCGGRILDKDVMCQVCRSKITRARWLKLDGFTWNGDLPLAIYQTRIWFPMRRDLQAYVNKCGVTDLSVLNLVKCRPYAGPQFSVRQYIRDHLVALDPALLPARDADLPVDEHEDKADAAVCEYVALTGPYGWRPVDERPMPGSVAKFIVPWNPDKVVVDSTKQPGREELDVRVPREDDLHCGPFTATREPGDKNWVAVYGKISDGGDFYLCLDPCDMDESAMEGLYCTDGMSVLERIAIAALLRMVLVRAIEEGKKP